MVSHSNFSINKNNTLTSVHMIVFTSGLQNTISKLSNYGQTFTLDAAIKFLVWYI